jgi:hypothetical protein
MFSAELAFLGRRNPTASVRANVCSGEYFLTFNPLALCFALTGER